MSWWDRRRARRILHPARRNEVNREDPEISRALERVFQGEGIRLELGAKVERVSRSGDGVALGVAGGRELRGSHLLVATGVLVDPKTERALGAAIVGAEAGELIHVFVALIQAKASVRSPRLSGE